MGEHRLDANLNELEQVIDKIPPDMRCNMFYMLDETSVHFAQNMIEWLDEHFLLEISPAVNHLQFFIWRFIKDKVYTPP